MAIGIRPGDTPTKPTSGKVVVNGPRPGGQAGGRRRNTGRNLYSKSGRASLPGTVGLPGVVAPVSPSSALGFGDQLASAQYDYLAQLAALRQKRAALIGDFGVAKADARSQRIQDVTDVESNALQRGIVGSSADLAGRAGTVTDEAAAVAAARENKNLGLLDLGTQRIDASNALYSTMTSIESQRALERAMNTIGQFQDNLFQDPNAAGYQDILKQLLSAIQDGKAGRGPTRTRRGLGTPSDPETVRRARLARLLREGL